MITSVLGLQIGDDRAISVMRPPRPSLSHSQARHSGGGLFVVSVSGCLRLINRHEHYPRLVFMISVFFDCTLATVEPFPRSAFLTRAPLALTPALAAGFFLAPNCAVAFVPME